MGVGELGGGRVKATGGMGYLLTLHVLYHTTPHKL